MRIPSGMVAPEGKVLQLLRSIYGLKQSGKVWADCLTEFLLSIGFTRSDADPCLYTKHEPGTTDVTIVAVYVDDLICAASNTELLEDLKSKIGARFKIGDARELTWCLGMEIIRDRKNRTLEISLERYIKDMLEAHSMTNCHPVLMPADPSVKLTKAMSPESKDDDRYVPETKYQSLVGSLMYAAVTARPDIAYAVGAVARYMSRPGLAHYRAAKRILRYLRGTIDRKLQYNGAIDIELLGYADSDWAGEIDSRRSTTGYVFTLGGAAISWKSRCQPTVALSTAEAEYMAVSEAAAEAIWLRRLITSLGFKPEGPTTIKQDNQACIALAQDPVSHKRSKHIDIRHHFIRERVADGTLRVEYCPTYLMLADLLTKALKAVLFAKLRDPILGKEDDDLHK